MPHFKNALVSVSDKTGLVEFIKTLSATGTRIVSTGGTAKILRQAGIPVVQVSDQTGFPEVMDGRVKTLHPKIHMALLSRFSHQQDQAVLKEYGIEEFDLVVGNLYPFEAEPEIENIDIGGPSFLRAAAKNHERITVVCDPADYKNILEMVGSASDKEIAGLSDLKAFRIQLAAKVFAHTSAYDSMIANWMASQGSDRFTFQNELTKAGRFHSSLRYGENPQQKAAWYRSLGEPGLHEARILQGKELSYNNLLDLTAALQTLRRFEALKIAESKTINSAIGVAVKHNNSCGVAAGETIKVCVERTLAADPVSVFGGILAFNTEVDEEAAKKLSEVFLECILAPGFSKEALDVFAKKKNLRLLEWPSWSLPAEIPDPLYLRHIDGGFLVQTPDVVATSTDGFKISSHHKGVENFDSIPDDIRRELLFAWTAVAQLKSNAIAVTLSHQTLGLGMGQVNRIDAVQHAIERMQRFHSHADPTKVVLASDAFFPFPDSIEKIASAGIQWIIQPGGSVNDESVMKAASDHGVNMVLTGRRHFLH